MKINRITIHIEKLFSDVPASYTLDWPHAGKDQNNGQQGGIEEILKHRNHDRK